MKFLADTSAWTNVRKSSTTWNKWTTLMRAQHVLSTPPILLELLRGARDQREFERYRLAFSALDDAPVTRSEWQRALDVQSQLAANGSHRGVSLVDLVVAAAAEHAGATLLHYDKDFDLIAEVTGQPTEWIAPRGSL